MLWGANGQLGAFLLLAINGGTGLDHAIWLSVRSMGLVAYGLATLTVLAGLATTARAGDRVPGRGFVSDSHRALALLTVLAVGAHVLLLAFDRYARFGPAQLLVPFTSWYRPVWTGFGVLAAYVLLTVYVSFYLRSRIGYKTWRTLHFATFAVFVMATVHGLYAGTDAGAAWVKLLYAGSIASVALGVAYRLVRMGGPKPIWAWETRAGDIGGVRVLLAAGALAVGLIMPAAVLPHPRSSSASSPTQAPISSEFDRSRGGTNGSQGVPGGAFQDGARAFGGRDDAFLGGSD